MPAIRNCDAGDAPWTLTQLRYLNGDLNCSPNALDIPGMWPHIPPAAGVLLELAQNSPGTLGIRSNPLSPSTDESSMAQLGAPRIRRAGCTVVDTLRVLEDG